MLGYLWVLVPFLGVSLGAALLAYVSAPEDEESLHPLGRAALAFVGTQAALWAFVLWVL